MLLRDCQSTISPKKCCKIKCTAWEAQSGRGALLCFIAHKALNHGIKTAFHSLTVSLQSCLAPAMIAMFIGDLNKKPTRQHAKIFDGLYLAHGVCRRWRGGFCRMINVLIRGSTRGKGEEGKRRQVDSTATPEEKQKIGDSGRATVAAD